MVTAKEIDPRLHDASVTWQWLHTFTEQTQVQVATVWAWQVL